MTKRIGIIGAGIVGASAAFYLSKENINLTVIDDGIGQATAASAGIISPWLSQRRNKEWYFLAKEGAKFYETLIADLNEHLDTSHLYQKNGTLLFKKNEVLLRKLQTLAIERKIDAPEIGDIMLLSPSQAKGLIPNLSTQSDMLYITGGKKVDGAQLVQALLTVVKKRHHCLVKERVEKIYFDKQKWHVVYNSKDCEYDQLILACGAWLNHLLVPLGFDVDIKPQKGQLIELQTDLQSKHWPVIMPVGETDIIPFDQGKIVIGATHENNQGFNLDPSPILLNQLKESTHGYLKQLEQYSINHVRVGTRAYTSDFAPFFGEIDSLSDLLVASGLGSSGLTTGPIIGKTLADWALHKKTIFENYRTKPNQYILPKK